MGSEETARFLAGAPDRQRLLTHLAHTAGSPTSLATNLDLSRRSVQRHLKAFVDRGWARKADGQYHLTTTGTLVADEQQQHLETLDRIDRFAPLIQALPDSEHVPDYSGSTTQRFQRQLRRTPKHLSITTPIQFDHSRQNMFG